ncbi:hypothetical protein V8E36_006238 [Tilletia maclaganii]
MAAAAGSSQQRAMAASASPSAAATQPVPVSTGGMLGTLAPGTLVRVGAYTCTIKRYLSQGGFAHVYLVSVPSPIPMPPPAKPTTLLVLKRMAVPDKDALVVVRNEVETHKQLRSHPYIAHFLEASASTLPAPAGSAPGAPAGGYEIFILMEYCPGGGLIDLMNARLRNRLREAEVLHIFAHVCEGVAHMHHQKPPMLHRDLKVENILLVPPPAPSGSPGTLASCSNQAETISFKLCDFGSTTTIRTRSPPASMDEARALEADLNRHTTLQYRAPEMVDVYRRPPVAIGEPADIWALGVLLYKLCYYTTPFEENGGGPLAILNVRYRFPPQPSYSESLRGLIRSILVERPEARPSIDQLRVNVARLRKVSPPSDALKRLAAHDPSASTTSKPMPKVPTTDTGKASITSASSSSVSSASSVSSTVPPPLPARASPSAAAVAEDLISFGDDFKQNGSAGSRSTTLLDGKTPAKSGIDQELRDLEAHMSSKATMRRGRPAKPASVPTSILPPSAFPNDPVNDALTGSPNISAPKPTLGRVNFWTELEKSAGSSGSRSATLSDGTTSAKAGIDQEFRDLEAHMHSEATVRGGRLSKTSRVPMPVLSPSSPSAFTTDPVDDALARFPDISAPEPASSPAKSSTALGRVNLWTELEKPSASSAPSPRREPPPKIQTSSEPSTSHQPPKASPSGQATLSPPTVIAPPSSAASGYGGLLRPNTVAARIRRPGIPSFGGGPGSLPGSNSGRPHSSGPSTLASPVAVRAGAASSSPSLSASSPATETPSQGPSFTPSSAGAAALSHLPNNGLGIIRPKPMKGPNHRTPASGPPAGAMLKPIPNVGLVSSSPRTAAPAPVPVSAAAASSTGSIEVPQGRPGARASTPPPVNSHLHVGGSSPLSTANSSPAEEPFRGVSNLIARWQAHAEKPGGGGGGDLNNGGANNNAAATAAGGSKAVRTVAGLNADSPDLLRRTRLPGRDI